MAIETLLREVTILPEDANWAIGSEILEVLRKPESLGVAATPEIDMNRLYKQVEDEDRLSKEIDTLVELMQTKLVESDSLP